MRSSGNPDMPHDSVARHLDFRAARIFHGEEPSLKTASYSLSTYIMWNSGTSGSIDVPIELLTWSSSGTFTIAADQWVLKAGATSARDRTSPRYCDAL